MPDSRALSLIKQGSVTLMNDWLARRWSLLVGHTTDLQQRGDAPWVERSTQEFQIVLDGQYLGLMDLNEVEWAEDCTPWGAEVVMRRQNDDITLELRSFMFHQRPGLWRRARIMNRGPRECRLDQACVEWLPLPEGGATHTEGLEQPALGIHWQQEERVLALHREGDSFLLAAGPGGRCVFREAEGAAVVCTTEALPLPPARWVALPDAYLLPCADSSKSAWETGFEPFLRHLRSCVEYEQERIEAACADGPEDPPDNPPSGAPEN
jgi:hypothetical protein